jgi:hypothetical protein
MAELERESARIGVSLLPVVVGTSQDPPSRFGFADDCDGTCRDDDGNPVLPRPLLRPHPIGAREQHTDREIPPPHSISSSADASNAGGRVRPSVLAAFRLITNSNLVG